MPAEQVRAFRRAYGDVVMSVGATRWVGFPAVENRGIFRNPVSVRRRISRRSVAQASLL